MARWLLLAMLAAAIVVACSAAGKAVSERSITDDVRTRVDLPDMTLKKNGQYVVYVEGVADGSAEKLEQALAPYTERVVLTDSTGNQLENNLDKQKNTIYSDSYVRGAAIAAFKSAESGTRSISLELSGSLRDLKEQENVNKVVVREAGGRQSSTSMITILLMWVLVWFVFSRMARRRRMQRPGGPGGPPQPGGGR